MYSNNYLSVETSTVVKSSLRLQVKTHTKSGKCCLDKMLVWLSHRGYYDSNRFIHPFLGMFILV